MDSFKFGLSTDWFVGSSLIGLCFKYGDIVGAARVFDEIIKPDIVAFTSMITGYAQIGDYNDYDEGFRFAQRMQETELDPNQVTLEPECLWPVVKFRYSNWKVG